jgi:hypothetical protein
MHKSGDDNKQSQLRGIEVFILAAKQIWKM